MPTSPPSRTPKQERALAVVSGNPVRIAILGAITRKPRSMPSEIAEATGLSIHTVRTQLRALLQLGFVETDPPADLPYSERAGKYVRYTVVAPVLLDAYADLGRELGVDLL